MVLKFTYFCASFFGDVAQLVEQRTENPCVGGSIPSVTTRIASLGGYCCNYTVVSQFYNLENGIRFLFFNFCKN
jgi:hypothetical protein